MTDKKLCKREGCGREAMVRGVCLRDYSLAWRMVSQGRTSWPELVKEGKVDDIQLGSKSKWFEREVKTT